MAHLSNSTVIPLLSLCHSLLAFLLSLVFEFILTFFACNEKQDLPRYRVICLTALFLSSKNKNFLSIYVNTVAVDAEANAMEMIAHVGLLQFRQIS